MLKKINKIHKYMETLGIVIALYNEDSSWIHKLIEIPNIKIYIYLKNMNVS